MKKRTLLLVLPACLLLAGCELDSYEIPQEELYAREFVKNFGVFDKDHDWNMAAGASVTVNPGAANRVKVYAYVDGRRYIFADYEDVQGTQTIGFDLPKNIDEVIVKVGNVERTVKVGGTVDFSDVASRSIYDVNTDGIKVSKSDHIALPHADVLSYRETLPEGTNNVGKVTENFNFKANGSFTIYPVYWNTRHVNTLGIYTKNADGTVNKYPIFKNDGRSDDLQYRKYTPGQVSNWCVVHPYAVQDEGYKDGKDFVEYTDQDWVDFKIWLVETYQNSSWAWFGMDSFNEVVEIKKYGEWTDEEWNNAGQKWEGIDKTKVILVKVKKVDTPDGSYQTVTGNVSANTNVNYYDWQMRGITIDIAEGVEFGMYIDNTDDNECFYSEASLNTDPYKDKDGTTHTDGERDPYGNVTSYDKTACHAATYMYTSTAGDEYRVLAFEDWTNAHKDSDMDFNDMVFFITSAVPAEIPSVNPDPDPEPEDEPYSWILAAEDLGNLDDFDFNDVVVSVEHVAGHTEAKITALAAGGTLPIYLVYNGTVVGDEFHAWFGDGHYSTSDMINTGNGPDAPGKSVTITVPADFRMSHDTSKVDGGNMGGFSVKVQRADGTFDDVKAPEGSDGNIEAPQMICLPDGWKWPKERMGINVAYPSFDNWCKDHTCNNWHESCVGGCVYNK